MFENSIYVHVQATERQYRILLVSTLYSENSEIIDHRGASMSEQQTDDSLICHGNSRISPHHRQLSNVSSIFVKYLNLCALI